jgi:hypothetical protein
VVILALVPSGDRLGRLYPLAGSHRGRAWRADADAWVEAVLYDLADAAEGLIGPDDLARRLAAVPPPAPGADEPPTSSGGPGPRPCRRRPKASRASQFWLIFDPLIVTSDEAFGVDLARSLDVMSLPSMVIVPSFFMAMAALPVLMMMESPASITMLLPALTQTSSPA